MVKNPEIPFKTKLDIELLVGTKITVTGHILLDAFRFAINIRHGWKAEGRKILFHLNPRFDEPNVVYDTSDGSEWMKIGRKPSGTYFTKGNNFTVDILCEEDQFLVTVDGDPFLEYKYRLPLELADVLEIQGTKNRDVAIFLVSVSNSPANPIGFSGSTEKYLNLNENDAFRNNVTCNSTSPFLIMLLIFFVLLSAVFFMVILWLKRWLDFCLPKK
ncbi:unnamed protein product [Orchesella dallaii]|uniref:Galectin n=1 Tax=Orchesella dallaii TaxID=48710 RepID=A0ABP1PIB3_9HEXA